MTPIANIIQRSKAVLVLFVFGLSLMPRQVIHNFVTNHRHIKYSEFSGKAQVATESFSCKADTIFLQQGFDKIDLDLSFSCLPPVVIHLASLPVSNPSIEIPQHSLRGPPVFS